MREVAAAAGGRAEAAGSFDEDRSSPYVGGDGETALRENKEVRLGLENGEREELVLPSGDARVQGRVGHIVHPAENRAGGGA